MRIGFDATAIPALRAGAGNYIYHLILSLAEVDSTNDYFIFAQTTQVDDLQVHNSNFHFVPISAGGRMSRLLWEQTVLPNHIRRLKLDLFHSPHYTMPLLSPAKSVVTFHDMTFFLFPHLHRVHYRIPLRNMIRWSAQRASQIIAVSHSTKNDTIRCLNIPSEKLTTIPLAASSAFRPVSSDVVDAFCKRHDLVQGSYICFVGVLEPRKGIPTLIAAFSRVVRQFPQLMLVIAGKKGWMYEEIVNAAQKLGISERVRFMGYVDEADLVNLINGAQAFVYPSLYEGFGIPVLEAMQCGTAVITTNVSSLPEVAGDAAILIEPNDTDALVAALRRLLTQKDLIKALSERGIARSKQFQWKRTAEETLKVYETALNRCESEQVEYG